MRSKVAVVTVQGKAYFLIVKELKLRNILFLSLIPGDSIPIEIKVVITTASEKYLVHHEKVLVYDIEMEPQVMGSQVVRSLQGKEAYEKVIIGVDPGVVFGLAVIADGGEMDSENCFSVEEVAEKIRNVLKTIDFTFTVVDVKIGNGVIVYKKLVETLDYVLPPEVLLEIVNEAGTNHYARKSKHSRGLRHIASAKRIAGREGYIYPRRLLVDQNS
jgi:hypothetical protein